MTQFPIASPLACPCCRSAQNCLFLHGPCNAGGQIQAAKYQVVCDACGTSGPLCETAEKALKGWRLICTPAIIEQKEETPPALVCD